MTDREPGTPSEPDPLGLVGTVLAGRYRVLDVLGRGGMGTVYLGEHVNIGRKTALKVLQAADHDPGSVARFVRGAQNAARIDHPNVCRVFDFGDPPGGLYFLAMEFVDGESLYDIQKAEGALSPERAASIVAQTAGGLHAAHDLGIVHRDLKPGNIMITRAADGRELVKVVDFDIAKEMAPQQGDEVTTHGWVVGTPEYMSPEQFMGGALDARTDVYSLGVILFRLLSGRFPFSATTPRDIMMERLRDEPLTLESVTGKAFPAGLQSAIDGALRIAPDERWPTALHFARAVLEPSGAAAAGAAAAPAPEHALPATLVAPVAPSPTDSLPATIVSPGAASSGAEPRSGGSGSAGRRLPGRAVRIAVAVLTVAAGGLGAHRLLRPDPSPASGVDALGTTPPGGPGQVLDTVAALSGRGGGVTPEEDGEGEQSTRRTGTDGAEARDPGSSPASTNGAATVASGGAALPPPDAGGGRPADAPRLTAPEARRILTGFEDRFVALLLTGVPESVAADAVEQASRIFREFEGRGEDAVRSQAAFVLSKAHYYRGRTTEALTWAGRAWELEPVESRRLWLERLRSGGPDPATPW